MKKRVKDLAPGDYVDLEQDPFADPQNDWGESDNPEFEFSCEVVEAVVQETPDCLRVDFESGFSCGFPPNHEVEVDE